MSSLFNHAFIPIVILLIFSRKLNIDPRKILILGFFAILPDIDIFLDHRASLHNIYIVMIVFLIFVLIKESRYISGIICFYLLSHIILDIFNGGIYYLYPLSSDVLFAHAEIGYDGGIVPVLSYGINDKIINTLKWRESILSSESSGTILLLAIIILISYIKDRIKND